MKQLLLMIGITGVLGLVNAGTHADAAIKHGTGSVGPQGTCDPEVCENGCVAGGCYRGVCVPNGGGGESCECVNENLTRCL
jgi:hypothetical protein